MKVWVLHGIGDIQFEVRELRSVEGEVIVKVKNKNNPNISMKNEKEIQKFL